MEAFLASSCLSSTPLSRSPETEPKESVSPSMPLTYARSFIHPQVCRKSRMSKILMIHAHFLVFCYPMPTPSFVLSLSSLGDALLWWFSLIHIRQNGRCSDTDYFFVFLLGRILLAKTCRAAQRQTIVMTWTKPLVHPVWLRCYRHRCMD